MKQIKKYSDLVILLMIWMVSIYSLISVIVNSYIIGIQNYIGYGLLVGVSALRFFKVKRFKTILGGLLVVGSINVIQFTYSTMTFIFTWSPMGHSFSSLGIQPLSASLLILLIVLNFSDFIKFLAGLFSEDPKMANDRRNQIASKYDNELKNEKNSTLQDIVDHKNMYQTEYVKAAQRLIEERRNEKPTTEK
jgi:hypothetical protein